MFYYLRTIQISMSVCLSVCLSIPGNKLSANLIWGSNLYFVTNCDFLIDPFHLTYYFFMQMLFLT